MAWAAAVLLVLQVTGSSITLQGTVVDTAGSPIAAARVAVSGVEAATAADGTFAIIVPSLPTVLVVRSPGFADRRVAIGSTPPSRLRIVLEPRGITESLTVSASDRGRLSSPAAVTVLDRATLESAPALTLDEQLRSVPGFSLFRRSSSRVANPTTQGVTLRGLAASGASRATVSADGLSLTDPFGGWVYWDRVPAAAIERVEVTRGGASDVFGSDAMGGAIRIDTAASGARVLADAGEDRTARISAFGGTPGTQSVRGGLEQFTTDGFVTVAPESRGPIDTPASSSHTSAFVAVTSPVSEARLEARAGYFSEDRGNGTPFQTNATTGRDLSINGSGGLFRGLWTVRGALTSQGYDQTFSAVSATRTSERPTSAQRVDASSRSVNMEWLRPMNAWTFLVAVSGRQVDATLANLQLPNPASLPPETSEAIQRTGSLSTQLSWSASPRATVAAGVRAELWSTRLRAGEGSKIGFFAPRLSIAYRAAPSTTIRLSLQNAYRLPTINELYRPFRVGNVQTLPDPGLLPEESYGADGSVVVTRGRAVIRATAFLANVNDAIVNATISDVAGFILRRRANAAHIRAGGIEVESELRLRDALSVTAAGTVVSSTFTGGGELSGRRVPQVPRAQLSAGLRGAWPKATGSLDVRHVSRQFDDDRNEFELADATIVDARASWIPRRGLEVFVSVENLFDVEQDVGRTPLRTIGLPRTARVGVRIGF